MGVSKNELERMLSGAPWQGPITFSFINPSSVPSYYTDAVLLKEFGSGLLSVESLLSQQQASVQAAAAAWMEVANISISETTSGVGDIAIGRIPFDPSVRRRGVLAGTFNLDEAPNAQSRGDIWLSTANLLNPTYLSLGGVGFFSILHEMGHALGLHGDKLALAGASYDSYRYTVMSYNDSVFNDTNGPITTGPGGIQAAPSTPMLYDIAAIQLMYGANASTRAGSDDSYTFEVRNHWPVQAIWDAGGLGDVISAGAYQDRRLYIDLNPGGHSYVMDRNGQFVVGQPEIFVAFQPLLSDGSLDPAYDNNYIENAIGGSKDDIIIGNRGNNRLEGGDGADRLVGGWGDDVLIGGTDPSGARGIDVLEGGFGNDTYVYQTGDGQDTIFDVDGLGVIQINGVALLTVASQLTPTTAYGSKRAWRAEINGEEVLIVEWSGDVDDVATIRIEGAALGPNGSIEVRQFSNTNLGITLDTLNRIDRIDVNPSLMERQSTPLGLHLAAPARGGYARIAVDPELATFLRVVTGAETLSFNANGTVDVPLEFGQSILNLALLAEGDVDASATIALSATLIDAQGNPIGTATNLNIAFNAVVEAGSTNTFTGDFHVVDFDPGSPGVQPHYDQYGNRITDSTPEPIQDLLTGSSDNDTIIGGAHGDVLRGQGGDDQIFADAQVDIATAIANGALGTGGGTRPLVLSGAADNDILSGGAGRDIVVGSDFGDVVSGGAGDDLLIAGQGSDFIMGDTELDASSLSWTLTESPDYVWNPSGTVQWIYANVPALGGNDVIYAGSGDDEVLAGFGDDVVHGESGNDLLAGGGGNDTLLGGEGNDLLVGDQDFDAFYTNSIFGSDFLDGGAGDDVVRGQGGTDVLFGGAGNDNLYGDELDQYGGDDYLNGEDGDDTLHGRAGADTLIGGEGADNLYGDAPETAASHPEYQGDDHLDGGAGNDQLVGLGGSDTLLGGGGNDTLYGDSLGTTAAFQGDDFLDGGDGDDFLQGDGGSDTLFGGAGADTLIGDSSTTPESIQGDDHLDGGDGNDQLYGGGGADTLIGGLGDDTLYGDDSSTPVAAQLGDYLEGGEGNDILGGGGGADTLIGGAGNDMLYGEFADTPASVAAGDFLDGGDGDDTLLGEGGDDTLLGGAGNDILSGGDGDDYLETGGGNDNLFGGAGNDTFVISADAGNVQISDTEGVNTIRLEGTASSSAFSVSFLNGWTRITTSPTSSVTVQGDLAAVLGSIQFSDGATASSDALVHRYQPGAVGTNQSIGLLNGVTASQVSAQRWNDDLILSYSGSEPNWVALGSLQSRGVGARLVSGEAYGLAAGASALVLINWYQANSSTYVNYLLDSNNTATDLLPITSAAPITRAGTNADDALAGGPSAETLVGSLGNDDLAGGGGNDTYVFRTGDGRDYIQDTAGSDDAVRFGPGITVADLTVTESTSGLEVVVGPAANGDAITIANWSRGGGESIDRFVFENGTSLDRTQIDALNTANHSPRLAGSVTDQVIRTGQSFSYSVPQGLFSDADAGDTLTYRAFQADWSALPGWLTFNAQTRTFSGVPSAGDAGTSSIQVIAIDSQGLWNHASFDLRVTTAVVLTGTAADDTLWASAGQDYELYGLAGNDFLYGNSGNDLLVGGPGSDFLRGSGGNDVFLYSRGDGSDEISISDSGVGKVDTLRFGSNINVSDVLFSSNHGGDLIIKFRNADGTIDIGDSIRVTNFFGSDSTLDTGSSRRIDRFEFVAGQVLSVSDVFALASATQENDWLVGSTGADTVAGQGGDDHLFGLEGNDSLSGDEGDDYLDGGVGSDTYFYGIGDGADWISGARDSASSSIDAIQFGAGIAPSDLSVNVHNWIDSLRLTVSSGGQQGSIYVADGLSSYGSEILDEIRFADGTVWTRATIEALSLIGTPADDDIYGYATNDTLRGNDGNDSLRGGAGNDDLFGGAGNDSLFGEDGDDTYHFGRSQGHDELLDTAGVNQVVLDAGILPAAVTLYRTSSTGVVSSTGSSTVDDLVLVLDGGLDQLRVIDYYASGTPISQIAFSNGVTWDAAAIASRVVNVAGTANTFTGTTANNSYTVDHPNDVINEPVNGGTDSVSASVSYTLPSNVENLTLTGLLHANGTGNDLQNVLTGNAADNVLNGRGGVDTLNGLGGNDTFNFFNDDLQDTLAGGPGDDVYYVGVEGLSTTGAPEDLVVEAANEGYDTIYAAAWQITLPANVERVIFQPVSGWSSNPGQRLILGNALNNYIDASLINYGTAAGTTFLIDGGAGADTMIAVRNRTNRIIVDNVGDVVVGSASDTVAASVSYAISGSIGTLELTGSDAISGTGNSAANWLIGATNSASNILTGGLGDDEYVIDASDVVVEAANAGSDTVRATFVAAGGNVHAVASYANVENLRVDDSAQAATLLGSAIGNTLTGNAFGNVLDGAGGDDTLVGGAGSDRYVGFTAATGHDVIVDASGRDSIELAASANINASQLNAVRSGDDLLITTSPDSSIRVQGWYASASNTVEELSLYDGGLRYTYVAAQLTARAAGQNSAPVVSQPIADAAAQIGQPFTLQLHGNTFADLESQASLSYAATLADGSALPTWLAFNPATRTFSGTPTAANAAALTIRVTATDAGSLSSSAEFVLDVGGVVRTGTADDDSLVGDGRAEMLRGIDRADTLNGAGGNDQLLGGDGDDTYILDASSGNDVIRESDGWDRIEFTAASGVALANLALSRVGNDLRIGYGANSVVVKDHYASASSRIEELVAYQSGVSYVYSAAQLEGLVTAVNTAPYVGTPIPDRAARANTTWTYQIPANTFTDTQSQSSLTYSARLVGGAALPSWLTFTAGTRTLSGKAPNGTNSDYAIEIVATDPSGLATTDAFTLRIRSALTTWTGTANADTNNGSSGADYQIGLGGNDTLRGGAGDDIQEGGDGNDVLQGQDGSDVLFGGSGNDILYAMEPLNSLYDGTNVLYGEDGHDQLYGGGGADTLIGGRGDDTLSGGAQLNTLVGGEGSDTYVYTNGAVDTIDNASTDLEEDKLVIAGTARAGITFTRVGNDLQLNTAPSGQITVRNWFTDPRNRIDLVQTMEGLVTTADEIDSLISGGGQAFQSSASMQSSAASELQFGARSVAPESQSASLLSDAGISELASNQPLAAAPVSPMSPDAPQVEEPQRALATDTMPLNAAIEGAPTGPVDLFENPKRSAPAWRVRTPWKDPHFRDATGEHDQAIERVHSSSLHELMEAAARFRSGNRLRASSDVISRVVQESVGGAQDSAVMGELRHEPECSSTDRQLVQLISAAATFADFGTADTNVTHRRYEENERSVSALGAHIRRMVL